MSNIEHLFNTEAEPTDGLYDLLNNLSTRFPYCASVSYMLIRTSNFLNREVSERKKRQLVSVIPSRKKLFFDVSPSKTKPAKAEKVISQLNIINKFMESNSRIVHKSKDEKGDVSIDVNVDNDSDDVIISETLANILFEQKSFEKAIKMYEKLCLKYPNKSSYFAAQINSAKEHLKV